MINTHDNVWIPSDGYAYVSNGTVWSTEIRLGKKDNIANWHDTNEEPPAPEDPTDPETQELADVVNDAYTMADELIGG